MMSLSENRELLNEAICGRIQKKLHLDSFDPIESSESLN